jgi:hypothetical protein
MQSSFFAPGATAPVSVSGTSARVAIPSGGTQLSVLHNLASFVFMKFGDSSVTASTTDTPVEPGISRGFTKPGGVTHVAFITSSATGTVYVTAGEGY